MFTKEGYINIMSIANLEHRSFNFEVRAEQDEKHGSIIVGRPIVYESKTNIGDFDEIIARGALKNTNLTDVRFLVNHDVSRIPLARSRKNNENSTMQLTVDDEGMGIRVDLDTENNSDARSLYSAVQRGDVTGMSFMFGIDDEEWSDIKTTHPTRTINSISTVVEVSAVTFPAYDETSINARDTKRALENARSALDNARTNDDKVQAELEKLKIKYLMEGI